MTFPLERLPKSRRGPPPAYDLVVAERNRLGDMITTAVVFVAAAHPTATTHVLRRIADDPSPPHHVILVTDERRPLRCGAKGQAYYDELVARGTDHFLRVKLSFAEYAQLDAMVSLLGQARVNDFEVEHAGQVHIVSESELQESLHRLDQFRAHPLLHDLLTEEGHTVAPPPPPPPFDDSLVDSGIRAYLSWRTGASATEVANKLIEDQGAPSDLLPAAVHQVIRIADELHRQGVLHSTPEDRDRYLLWLGRA